MEQHNTIASEGNGSNKVMMCRQSSTRWTPTADQVRILKDLYYNNGLRSPTADQIQRISATLRQYGKIEGKNVFYWFQNHKARERQKKRFNSSTAAAAAGSPPDQHHHRRHFSYHHQYHLPPMQTPSLSRGDDNNVNDVALKNDQECSLRYRSYGSNNVIPAGYYCGSSASASFVSYANGKMADSSIESASMERRFRDCSISASSWQRISGVAMTSVEERRCYHTKTIDFLGCEQRNIPVSLSVSGEEKEEEISKENRKTLPLFPINPSVLTAADDELNQRWCTSDGNGDGGVSSYVASLELSLNSYTGVSSPSSSD